MISRFELSHEVQVPRKVHVVVPLLGAVSSFFLVEVVEVAEVEVVVEDDHQAALLGALTLKVGGSGALIQGLLGQLRKEKREYFVGKMFIEI